MHELLFPAVVGFRTDSSEIINPFFPEIVQTFTRLSVEHNYEVLLSSLPDDSQMFEAAARQMIEGGSMAWRSLPSGEESLIDVFRSRNIPLFVADVDSPGASVKTVRIDYEHGIRQAVQHLAALGHTRIAFISGPVNLKTAVVRKAAFQECMKEIGLATPSQLLAEGDHTMEAGMRAMLALSGLANRPSAVICSNDLTAIGVM